MRRGFGDGVSRTQQERDEANYKYFVALAESRASLTDLPRMAFTTAVALSLVMIPLGSMVFYGEHHVELLPLFNVHLVMIGFSVVVFVLSLFRGWVFRFQVFSSTLATFFMLVGMVYSLCFMALAAASLVEDPVWSYRGGVMVSGERLEFFAGIGFVFVCGAFVVHGLLLRKRLREGHSEKRRMGNYMAGASARSSKSLWIIFGVALVGGNLATGGEYVVMTVGLSGFLLFAMFTTSIPVEFGYLAYLKSRDRRYWEERPPKAVVTRSQVVGVLKKIGKWVLIVLGVLFGFVMLLVLWPRGGVHF